MSAPQSAFIGATPQADGPEGNEQQRTQPWSIFRWLEMLTVDTVLIENVRELRNWGPPNKKGYPIKTLRGTIYRAWLSCLRAHGYTVEERILNSANYGAFTSRERLFVAAVRPKSRPTWPVPTHSREGWPKKRWRAAREIIDWSNKGESIFTRKKPLSPRTMQRIIEGLKRFGGPELKPFIILMEHGGGVRDVDDPLPTITTAKGGSFGLAEAFLLSQGSGGVLTRQHSGRRSFWVCDRNKNHKIRISSALGQVFHEPEAEVMAAKKSAKIRKSEVHSDAHVAKQVKRVKGGVGHGD